MHTTEKYYRFRQFDPDYTDSNKMFITVKGTIKGIKYIVFVNKKDYYSVNKSNQIRQSL